MKLLRAVQDAVAVAAAREQRRRDDRAQLESRWLNVVLGRRGRQRRAASAGGATAAARRRRRSSLMAGQQGGARFNVNDCAPPVPASPTARVIAATAGSGRHTLERAESLSARKLAQAQQEQARAASLRASARRRSSSALLPYANVAGTLQLADASPALLQGDAELELEAEAAAAARATAMTASVHVSAAELPALSAGRTPWPGDVLGGARPNPRLASTRVRRDSCGGGGGGLL